MKKLRAFLTFIMMVSLLLPIPALAATITVTLVPAVTGGITGFVITYINEKQIDMDWGYDPATTVNRIMIRAKYGEYPADIPNPATTPSDGYLVYYGNGIHTSDTSMDFDQNPGAIFYKAWGQNADGTWQVTTNTGYKESQIMTLLFFLGFAGVMTFFGIKSTYWILKVLAGFCWWAIAAYWITNKPTNITSGSSTDTIVVILLIFIGVAMVFMPFWFTKNENGQEVPRGFRFSSKEDEEETPQPTRDDRTSDYSRRVNGALNGRMVRRRY
jgi:hypothetical protein